MNFTEKIHKNKVIRYLINAGIANTSIIRFFSCIAITFVLFVFFITGICYAHLETLPFQTQAKGKVIVVGGGISGLLTAYELEKHGVEVELLEAGVRFGGRVGTASYGKGLQAEYGLQEIWEHNPILNTVKELGLETKVVNDPFSSVFIDGKLYPFVQDTRDDFFKSIFNEKELVSLKQVLSYMEKIYLEAQKLENQKVEVQKWKLAPHLKHLQDISFAQWLSDMKVPLIVKKFLELELEVELGTHADRFSALSGIIESKIFLFGGENFYHVLGGNYRLIEALANTIKGPKHLGARVTKIERKTGTHGKLIAEVSYIKNGAEIKKIYGDAVVVAVPWVWLHFIQFDPPLTKLQLKGIYSLGRGQYSVLHLVMSKEADKLWSIKGNSPFVILSNTPMGCIYGPSNFSKKEGDSNKLVFSLLVYGDEAQAWHLSQHETKRAQIVNELEKLWPGFSKYVLDSSTYTYHPAAIAYWPAGRSQMDVYSQALRIPNKGLFLVGDYLYGSHSHAAAQSAIKIIPKILQFLSY